MGITPWMADAQSKVPPAGKISTNRIGSDCWGRRLGLWLRSESRTDLQAPGRFKLQHRGVATGRGQVKPRALARSANWRVKKWQSPVSSLGSRKPPLIGTSALANAGSARPTLAASRSSKGTPHSCNTATSRAAAPSWAWLRKSCKVPWLRASWSIPVSARQARKQSRLYSDSRFMRSLLTAWWPAEQLASMAAIQRHWNRLPSGRKASGARA